MQQNETVLALQGVHKTYPDFRLEDVTLELEKGCIMGLIGPNGAGKSTTIKAVLNLVRCDAGRIEVFGLDHVRHERTIKNKIGFVLEQGAFYPELTTEDMKKIIAPFYERWDERLFHEHRERFSLPRNKKIKNLSKGMKMKFALCIALSHHAEFLIMDEPTDGLDPVVRREFMDILGELCRREEQAILYSTHITSDIETMVDYVTFLDEGKMVFSLSREEMLERFALVRGPLERLGTMKELGDDADLVGISRNAFGFQGLLRHPQRWAGRLPDVTFATPSLEDILVYHKKGEHHVESGL